jgi:hypothetical protein
MRGIAKQPFIDCQEHIDTATLKELNLEICSGIALSDIKAGVYGPGVVNADQYGNFLELKNKLSTSGEYGWNRMTHNQQNLFSKLYLNLYNPSTTVYLRGPQKELDSKVAYRKKCYKEFYEWDDNINHFPKLKIWLDNLIGSVFEQYGRIIFFIHEHDCKLLLHRDAPKQFPHRTEFLWLNPMMIKDFYVYDDITHEKHSVKTPAAFFNDLDMHGGEVSSSMTWSLRIDGVFTEEFRKRIGISQYKFY